MPYGLGSQTQHVGNPVPHFPRLDRQHFAAANAVIRAEAQPSREVLHGGEGGEIGTQLGEEGMDARRLQPWHLGEINAQDAVHLGPQVTVGEVHGMPRTLFARVAGSRRGLILRVDPTVEVVEQTFDLRLTFIQQM